MRCRNSDGGYFRFAGVRESPLNRETVHLQRRVALTNGFKTGRMRDCQSPMLHLEQILNKDPEAAP
jgi:hypothetical protein